MICLLILKPSMYGSECGVLCKKDATGIITVEMRAKKHVEMLNETWSDLEKIDIETV